VAVRGLAGKTAFL